jgi:cell division protein FtsL
LKNTRLNNSVSRRKSGPFPARKVLIFAVVVAAVIVFPLLTVWKKDYISDASMKQKSLADSVAILSARVADLRLESARLCANERIEHLAMEWLGLQYPDADNVVIVGRPAGPGRRAVAGIFEHWKFLAALRRSLDPERG